MTAATQIDGETQRAEHQLNLERIFDKHQLLPRVRETFADCKEFDFVGYIKQHEIPEKFGLDVLAQISIHKRATVATMVGCLRHHCEPSLNAAQETAQLLERAVMANLLTYSERDQQFIVIYEISDWLQQELDKFQYPLPMIIEPKELKNNLDSGYLTQKGSVILRDNHTNDDVCLDHLNRLNSQKLTINLDVAITIQNKWKGLNKKDPSESWEDFKRRKKQFEKYDRCAKDVIGIVIQEGNELYFNHKYDKRGRTYCMGHHLTYQGTDWNKAVLEFADKELVLDK